MVKSDLKLAREVVWRVPEGVSLGRAPSLRRWCNADSHSDWASDGVRVDEGLRAVTVILCEGSPVYTVRTVTGLVRSTIHFSTAYI